ncbi:metal-dependent hydrolase [Glaciibacter psychrotolerans]|uniref:Membrane-bound metal-dependent hydrolase YbcI (DUF457 family) n=1 Tax=Glaciibacter psychrotolerans TaxID=670054 RepID=A0A7Z0EC41_9MICO|nr:metal-dependent hydrolase [Leifsonia psychrotolerans]NYJ18933.1 membrane-bound metal-dependent hydrolase YbcI (DUF457 family) [Leifsonia psychrotolerans]
MMGSHHALSGAAVWVAITSTTPELPTLGWVPLGPTSIVLGAIVCAGAALLPDADHHNATIAHSLPGIGTLATGSIRAASGGHRHGTHSPLMAALVLITAFGLTQAGWPANAGVGLGLVLPAVIAAALLAFAVKVLRIVRQWRAAWVVGVIISGAISWYQPAHWAWLPLCIAVGWITHLIGDLLTTGGLPLLWPLVLTAPRAVARTPVLRHLWSTGGFISLPLLGNAGSWREWCLMVPTALYAAFGILRALGRMLPVA